VTFTLPDGDGDSGQTLITNGSGTLAWAAPYGNRNLIINGAMQVAQRGTSAATKTNIAYHTVDRFKIGPINMGTFTHTQESDGPAGFTKSVKLECTTADASPAASDSITIQNIIEAQDLQHLNKGSADAKSVTLSFYVKSNKTGTYTAEIFDGDNNRHISKTFTVSSSGTWEYKTITFVGDTSGALNNDNGVGFYVLWHLGAGSDFTSGTLGTSWQANDTADRVSSSNVNLADTVGNYFQLTGVQLEVGEQATPFEHEPYGVTLQKAQRYYISVKNQTTFAPVGVGRAWSGTNGNVAYYFPCEMRSNPTVSVASLSKFDIVPAGGNPTAVQNDGGNLQSVKVGFVQSAGITNGAFYQFEFGNNTDGDLRFDAEL
jgi:hypothetical protein